MEEAEGADDGAAADEGHCAVCSRERSVCQAMKNEATARWS